MPKCRITVLKCLFDESLKAQYIRDENYGPCPYFKPGDVIEYTGGEKPEAFGCAIGWRSIAEEAAQFARGQSFMGGAHILCCNDGVRPVIFKLEVVD